MSSLIHSRVSKIGDDTNVSLRDKKCKILPASRRKECDANEEQHRMKQEAIPKKYRQATRRQKKKAVSTVDLAAKSLTIHSLSEQWS